MDHIKTFYGKLSHLHRCQFPLQKIGTDIYTTRAYLLRGSANKKVYTCGFYEGYFSVQSKSYFLGYFPIKHFNIVNHSARLKLNLLVSGLFKIDILQTYLKVNLSEKHA